MEQPSTSLSSLSLYRRASLHPVRLSSSLSFLPSGQLLPPRNFSLGYNMMENIRCVLQQSLSYNKPRVDEIS